jgi:hypothetical protein
VQLTRAIADAVGLGTLPSFLNQRAGHELAQLAQRLDFCANLAL